MQITQQYTQPSSAQTDASGTKFSFSAELSRPPVVLNALIKNSLGYARLMLALRQVVIMNNRPQKDHSAYQEWVTQKYLEELPTYLQKVDAHKVKLFERKKELEVQRTQIGLKIKPFQDIVNKSRYRYFDWLYKNEREKWITLDPVISVHPDAVIFEAFSLDESSYARVSVPNDLLETFGETKFGTTNIDFSQTLADEIYRVRSYRPAWLKVAFDQVELSTSAGASLEKKIDLPDSWVRGFLQVQSASTIDGILLTLHSQTISQILAVLEQKKEKESPRSLRFILKKGEKPTIIIDPWQLEVKDRYVYQGDFEGEIRIWGRRRLKILKELLPYTDKVQVKLLGTGMPSYWTVELDGHRLDLGLSGWTANDWAKKGNFDLLTALPSNQKVDLQKALKALESNMKLIPAQLASILEIDRTAATYALQELCKNGQAMYDHLTETYRWRELLKKDIKIQAPESDERQKYAVELYKNQKVTIINQQKEEALTKYDLEVQGKNLYKTHIDIDLDGRIKAAQCTCSFYRRNKMTQGPCAHIMASNLQIAKHK